MGCPVPKVAIKNQAGSALLKNPDKIYEIVKTVVESVNVPITVKIRSGWDEAHINAVEVAKIIEKAGAKAIAIHGRTRSQGYSGKVNLNIIKKVKENITIPVIGNGDIKTVYDAENMLKETKCDAVMIGRGILGNPWLIKDTISYLENKTIPKEISKQEKIEMLKYHYELLKKNKNEKLALLEIRSLCPSYLKGIEGSKEIKQKLCQTKTDKEFYQILDNF